MREKLITKLIKSIVYLRTDNESSQEEKNQKVIDNLENLGVKFDKTKYIMTSMIS